MKQLEIERKFKLARFPQAEIDGGHAKVVSVKTIYQTYLAYTQDQEIRIRKLTTASGSKFTHTFKNGNGLSREEVEYSISELLYEQLLAQSGKAPLVKTRTTVEADGKQYDIDVYEQFALSVVESEFDSEDEAHAFAPPEWFGPEIGSEEEFRNKTLWAAVQPGSGAERKE